MSPTKRLFFVMVFSISLVVNGLGKIDDEKNSIATDASSCSEFFDRQLDKICYEEIKVEMTLNDLLTPCRDSSDRHFEWNVDMEDNDFLANITTADDYTNFYLRVNETISGWSLNEGELLEFLGGSCWPRDNYFELYLRMERLNELLQIVRLAEIRHLFGLKQQPYRAHGLLVEEPLDEGISLNKTALEFFGLRLFADYWSATLSLGVLKPIDTITLHDHRFKKANDLVRRFPILGRAYRTKFAELKLDSTVRFDVTSIDKAFEGTAILHEMLSSAVMLAHSKGLQESELMVGPRRQAILSMMPYVQPRIDAIKQGEH